MNTIAQLLDDADRIRKEMQDIVISEKISFPEHPLMAAFNVRVLQSHNEFSNDDLQLVVRGRMQVNDGKPIELDIRVPMRLCFDGKKKPKSFV